MSNKVVTTAIRLRATVELTRRLEGLAEDLALEGSVLAKLGEVRRQVEDIIKSSPRYQFPALPTTSPELWLKRKDKREALIQFIRRVYAEWLGRGLSRPHLRQLDKSLYAALCNWLSENKLPDDIDLPTLEELNRREILFIESVWGSKIFSTALRLYTASRRHKCKNRSAV